jgi:hypothetical protein
MSNGSLRECPFCGSDGEIYSRKNNEWVARCCSDDCPFEIVAWFPSEAEALLAWNTRAHRTQDRSQEEGT